MLCPLSESRPRVPAWPGWAQISRDLSWPGADRRLRASKPQERTWTRGGRFGSSRPTAERLEPQKGHSRRHSVTAVLGPEADITCAVSGSVGEGTVTRPCPGASGTDFRLACDGIFRCWGPTSTQVLRRVMMLSKALIALALSSLRKSRRIFSPSCSSRIAMPCPTMSSIRSRTS